RARRELRRAPRRSSGPWSPPTPCLRKSLDRRRAQRLRLRFLLLVRRPACPGRPVLLAPPDPREAGVALLAAGFAGLGRPPDGWVFPLPSGGGGGWNRLRRPPPRRPSVTGPDRAPPPGAVRVERAGRAGGTALGSGSGSPSPFTSSRSRLSTSMTAGAGAPRPLVIAGLPAGAPDWKRRKMTSC